MPTELEITQWRKQMLSDLQLELSDGGTYITDERMLKRIERAESRLKDFLNINDYSQIIGTINSTHIFEMVLLMCNRSGIEGQISSNGAGNSKSFSSGDIVLEYMAKIGYVIR